jgi:putative endonuclease
MFAQGDGMRQYSVYIMTNDSRTLYVGVTNNLARRAQEHKDKLVPGFTSKYNITQLVWYEHFDGPNDAISREKQLKGWRREKKVALIRSMNPDWSDLSLEDAERPFDSAQGDGQVQQPRA